MLLCASATAFSRSGGFAGPQDGLDEAGRRDAGRIVLPRRFGEIAYCSPAMSAQQTAQAMGCTTQIEPLLADLDNGEWSGLSFAAIEEAEPGALMAWLQAPEGGAKGGESLDAACARIAPWLDRLAEQNTPVLAVTHPMLVRAILAQTLGLPVATTLSIDLAPLCRVMLSFNGEWRLQSLGAGSAIAN
jgi:broad specificity phosphatase PhoE